MRKDVDVDVDRPSSCTNSIQAHYIKTKEMRVVNWRKKPAT